MTPKAMDCLWTSVKTKELSFSFVWWDSCSHDGYLSGKLYCWYWCLCYAACVCAPFAYFIYKHDSKYDLLKSRAKFFFFQASCPITVSNLLWLFGIEQNTFNWSILINWACWWTMMWSWYASLLATISNGCLAVRQNSPQIWFHRQKAKFFETWDLACTCYTSIYWYILE